MRLSLTTKLCFLVLQLTLVGWLAPRILQPVVDCKLRSRAAKLAVSGRMNLQKDTCIHTHRPRSRSTSRTRLQSKTCPRRQPKTVSGSLSKEPMDPVLDIPDLQKRPLPSNRLVCKLARTPHPRPNNQTTGLATAIHHTADCTPLTSWCLTLPSVRWRLTASSAAG